MARRNHRKNTPVRRGSVWPRVLLVTVLGLGGLLLWSAVVSRPPRPPTPTSQTPAKPAQPPQTTRTPPASSQSPAQQKPAQTTQTEPRNPVISVRPLETPSESKPELPLPPATPGQPRPEPRANPQTNTPAPVTQPQEQNPPSLTYVPQTDPRPRSNNPLVNPTPNTRVKIQGQPDGLILRRAPANASAHEADKVIALTFDDGPNPEFTPQVLQTLSRYNAKATFFWVGRELERNPETARAVLAAGHAAGNHTWTHRTAPTGELEAERELEGTQRQLEQVGGSGRLFRPPGGRLNNGLADWALRHGYTVVMWSAQSSDWEPQVSTPQIVQNVLGAAQPGAIVLLHDGGGDRSRTIAALPAILEGLQAQGYRFVTIPEMLATIPVQQ